jgi:F0F1-type ATP synthase assembly protein I
MSSNIPEDNSAETEEKNQLDPVFMGAGAFFGAAVGLPVGLVIDMPALGASSGMMLGMALGITVGFWKANE